MQFGDTLGRIAKEMLGNANAYMDINANKLLRGRTARPALVMRLTY